MSNARGDTTGDTIDIERIITEYYQQVCANNLNTIEEMNKCTELRKLPEFTQEETDQLKNLMSFWKVWICTGKLHKKKIYISGLHGFTGEF